MYRINFKIIEKKGYRISEVNRFLAKSRAEGAEKGSKNTVEEIENVRFSITLGKGYDPKEVDTYLDEMIRTHHQAWTSIKENENNYSETAKSSDQGTNGDGNNQAFTISSNRLRELTPPVVDGIGYDTTEVDNFLKQVADSLRVFEEKSGKALHQLKADQYMENGQSPRLLTADQIRWALFTVNDGGGYDMRGVDAAVNRLADVLDYHWKRKD